MLAPGQVLELGCGHGRNALFLTGLGCRVDAVDFSEGAIFDAEIEEGAYDLVYDSGCLHHLPPHRRKDNVGLVKRALKPGGSFGLVCFRPDGGSGYTDEQVYEHWSLGGGLGYSEESLRALWDEKPFSIFIHFRYWLSATQKFLNCLTHQL